MPHIQQLPPVTHHSSTPGSLSPHKLLGLNNSLPFATVLSESKLIYVSGSLFISEDTRTGQQQVLKSFPADCSVELIESSLLLNKSCMLLLSVSGKESVHSIMITSFGSQHCAEDSPPIFHKIPLSEGEKVEQLVLAVNDGHLCAMKINDSESRQARCLLMHTISGHIAAVLTCSQSIHVGKLIYERGQHLAIISNHKLYSAEVNEDEELSPLYPISKLLTIIPLKKIRNMLVLEMRHLPQKEEILGMDSLNLSDKTILFILVKSGGVFVYQIRKDRIQFIKNFDVRLQNNSSEPSCMQMTQNQVLISYHEAPILGVLEYNSFDVSKATFSFNSWLLSSVPGIKGVTKMSLFGDLCQCAFVAHISSSVPVTDVFFDEDYETKGYSNEPSHSQERHYVAGLFELLGSVSQSAPPKMTYSVQAAHAAVLFVQHCLFNDTFFVVLTTQVLKFYGVNLPAKRHMGMKRIQLWEERLRKDPIGLIAHPFMFCVVILYEQLVRVHGYNKESLLPDKFATTLKDCRSASFSPLGNRLILGGNAMLLVVDCYSFQVLQRVPLLNLSLSLEEKSRRKTLHLSSFSSKVVSKILHISNEEVLILSNRNTLELLGKDGKVRFFGMINLKQFEGLEDEEFSWECDPRSKSLLVALPNGVVILGEANLNSPFKCEVLTTLPLSSSSILLKQEVGLLFVGDRNGAVHMIRWPILPLVAGNNWNYTSLFECPVVSLSVSSDYKQMCAISAKGGIALCSLVIDASGSLGLRQVQARLANMSFYQSGLSGKWLTSYSDMERKEILMVKLRGLQAILGDDKSLLTQTVADNYLTEIAVLRDDSEKELLRDLTLYEEQYCLPQIIAEIASMKQECTARSKRHAFDVRELEESLNDELSNLFKKTSLIEVQMSKIKAQSALDCSLVKNQLDKELRDYLQETSGKYEQSVGKLTATAATSSLEKDIQKERMLEVIQESEEQLSNMMDTFKVQLELLVQEGTVKALANRKIEVEIELMAEKMGQFTVRTQQFTYDYNSICSEREKLTKVKNDLRKKLEDASRRADILMRLTKESLVSLKQSQSTHSISMVTSESMNLHLSELEARCDQVDRKYQELDKEFLEQKDIRSDNQTSLKEAEARLKELTAKRKRVCDHSVHLRLQLNQQKENSQSQMETIESGDIKLRERNKLAEDSMKWSKLKKSVLGHCLLNNRKLRDEGEVLLEHYNELMRSCRAHETRIGALQKEIKQLKTALVAEDAQQKQSMRATGKWSKHEGLPPATKSRQSRYTSVLNRGTKSKKMVYVSLHDDSNNFVTQS